MTDVGAKEIRLHPAQWVAYNSEARFVAAVAGTGGGKCLAPESQIPLASGSIKRVDQVVPGDTVLRKDEKGRVVPSKVTASFPSGNKPLYRITLDSGRCIDITLEHPLWGLEGWTPAGSFDVGDWVGVPRRYPDLGVENYDTHLLRVLGYLIGDGCLRGNSITFSNANKEVLDDLNSCLPDPCMLSHRSGCDWAVVGYGRGRSSTNPVLNLVKNWGLWGKKSEDKFIPDFVFRLPTRLIAHVLESYFACDGWTTERGFGISSASETLIRQVQHLLLRFGILSRVRTKITPCLPAWVLTVRGRENIKQFNKSFNIPGKDPLEIKRSSTNIDYQPTFPVDECWASLGSPRGGHSDREGYKPLRLSRRDPITHHRACSLAEHFDTGTDIVETDVFWDRVADIEYLGSKPVWDLTIKEGANFIACDIFAHNTFLGPVWLYNEIAQHPGEEWLLVAPTHKILRQAALPTLQEFFSTTDAQGTLKEQKGEYILPDGGKIYLRSAEKPNYIEAMHVRGVWADEPGQYKRWAWVVLQSRIGVSGGRMLLTTTPYFNNWLKTDIYDNARVDSFNEEGVMRTIQVGELADTYHVVQWPSILNPAYSQEEYDRMREQLTEEEFNLRYRGRFEQILGLVFPDFEECFVDDDPYEVKPDDLRVGGLDAGASDPFAAISAVYGMDEKLHLRREFYKPDTLLRDLIVYLDHNAIYYMDPAAKRERMEIEALGFDIRAGVNDILPGILKVREYMADRKLVIPKSEFPNLRSELSSYVFKQGTDKPDKSSPHHLVDSLRYMCMGVEDTSSLSIVFF